MKEKLLSLVAYTYWANRLIYTTLTEKAIDDEKIHIWASHILNAELIWLDRIEGISAQTPVFGKRPLDTLLPTLLTCNQRLKALIERNSEQELNQIISYSDSKGKPYENELSDLLFHLINHSTHHRSQIAARLRELGIAPPPTDYIYYKR